MKARNFVAPLFAISLASASYASDPFRPTEKQQVDLGMRAAAELRKTNKVLPASDPRSVLVNRIGHNLLSTFKDDKPWKFSFEVIDSKEVNAFALPGGPTFIYTGLLSKLKTEDELAGVMGHELTHVRKEHWAQSYASSQKRDLLITGLAILFHASRSLVDIASISNDLVFNLPFSRKHESEADAGGLEMMTKAAYNPQGIIDVFKLLQSLSGSGKTPEFLSDHPSDSRRVATLQKMVDDLHGTYPPQRNIDFAGAKF